MAPALQRSGPFLTTGPLGKSPYLYVYPQIASLPLVSVALIYLFICFCHSVLNFFFHSGQFQMFLHFPPSSIGSFARLLGERFRHCRRGSYFSSTSCILLWKDAHPLASGLSIGSCNRWWVKALKYNSVKWSKPGWGSGIFKGLSRVSLLLPVILAEVINWVCSAGSRARQGGGRWLHPHVWPLCAALSLSPSPLWGLT